MAAFSEANALEPSRAEAAAGIALLHEARLTTGAAPAEALARSERWARRALALDPHSFGPRACSAT